MRALDYQRYPTIEERRIANDRGYSSEKNEANPYVYGTSLWQEFENGKNRRRFRRKKKH